MFRSILGKNTGAGSRGDGLVYLQGGSQEDIGQFVDVIITRADNYDLVGEVAR